MNSTTAGKDGASKTLHIQNVGGVRDLVVKLAVGVNTLLGPNGSGKTSAIRAVTRAMGGDVPLEPRDGTQAGSVEGMGVKLAVRRVVKTSGEAEVSLADPSPLSTLIDPQMKDSDAAARARIRALLQLAPVPVTEAAIATLAGHEEIAAAVLPEIHELAIDDILTAAERVRTKAHAMAREAEAHAAAAAGGAEAHLVAAETALAALGGTLAMSEGEIEDLLAPSTDEQADRLVQDTMRHLEVARVGAEQRAELERQQAEIRATLGERPDPAAFDQDITLREDAIGAHERRIADLQQQIASERELMNGVGTDLALLRQQQRQATDQLRAFEQREAILAKPVTGPTFADVEHLEAALERAKANAKAASLTEEYQDRRDSARDRREEAEAATRRAEILRALAKSVQDRLGMLLRGTEAQGLTVVDGRLAVIEGGEVYDFELRRSEGQRVAAALRVAARAYPGKIVPLDGRYWQALDEPHQREFARLAASLGLFVITEAPADGELRCEPHAVVERELEGAVA